MWSPATRSPNVNAPVPIGLVSNALLLRSVTEPRTCLGTMYVSLHSASMGAYGLESFSTTVAGSGVVSEAIPSYPTRVAASNLGFMMNWYVNSTSAEVNGAPSCKVTPRRRWRGYCRPDFDVPQVYTIGIAAVYI